LRWGLASALNAVIFTSIATTNQACAVAGVDMAITSHYFSAMVRLYDGLVERSPAGEAEFFLWRKTIAGSFIGMC